MLCYIFLLLLDFVGSARVEGMILIIPSTFEPVYLLLFW